MKGVTPTMMKPALHWIDGSWTHSHDKSEAASINPANGEILGTFAVGGKVETNQAVAAARHAFNHSDWAHQPHQRAAVLLDLANYLEATQADLARRLTDENGNLLTVALQEIKGAISEARYYAGMTRNIWGRIMEVDTGLYAMTAREPVGVVGLIVPWKAPIALLIRSLAPALAAGCTVVVKAAAQTALLNAEIFKLIADIESLPSGVVNMINEVNSEAAQRLVVSPDVDMIGYTGNVSIGKRVMVAAADTLKTVNLALDGNSPSLIFADANLEQAIPAIVRANLMMAGQMYSAASRVLVHESQLEVVGNRLKDFLIVSICGEVMLFSNFLTNVLVR